MTEDWLWLCGIEDSPEPTIRHWRDRPPYEYNGYLKPYLDLIFRLASEGWRPSDIMKHLYYDLHVHTPWNTPGAMASSIHAILKKYQKNKTHRSYWMMKEYFEAQREHVWFLACEGIIETDIARRTGIHISKIPTIIREFGRRLGKALSKAKITIDI